MFVSLAVIVALDSARVLHYYGGDAGGSPGLLIVPSVVGYGILAAAVAGVSLIVRLDER